MKASTRIVKIRSKSLPSNSAIKAWVQGTIFMIGKSLYSVKESDVVISHLDHQISTIIDCLDTMLENRKIFVMVIQVCLRSIVGVILISIAGVVDQQALDQSIRLDLKHVFP